jgi:hypothetical protein
MNKESWLPASAAIDGHRGWLCKVLLSVVHSIQDDPFFFPDHAELLRTLAAKHQAALAGIGKGFGTKLLSDGLPSGDPASLISEAAGQRVCQLFILFP